MRQSSRCSGQGREVDVRMLPSHLEEGLHHESVMGGERARRGTRGTHGGCAEANDEGRIGFRYKRI
jgi:hypothetical protein